MQFLTKVLSLLPIIKNANNDIKHIVMKIRILHLVRFIMLSLTALCFLSVQAAEDDLYDFLWLDPDKKVYVLQNKTYQKQNTFYANVGYLKNNTSDFQDTEGVYLGIGYYMSEEWAIEACYNQYNNSDNDTLKNINQVNGVVPFIRKPKSSYGVYAIWSPFYGKINTFNKIIYLDWSFGLGVGKISTESNSKTVSNSTKADLFNDENYTTLKTKTGIRVHITEMFHVNLEYQRDNFRAPGPEINGSARTQWRNNSDVILSIGLSF